MFSYLFRITVTFDRGHMISFLELSSLIYVSRAHIPKRAKCAT
jgi:hypothetical protein